MDPAIEVEAAGGGAFRVTVTQGARTTSHEVTIAPGTLETLGISGEDPAAVVEESFSYLLEREPNTSILSSFELGVIGKYFPQYRDQIAPRMQRRSDR